VKRRSEQLGLDLDALAPRPAPESAAPAAEAPAAAVPARPDPSLPDAVARHRIATELDTNLLVEAGAGSGKTTALVSRMVALVRDGVADVTEIAAVTFTRKAAGELRERFQEALEGERGDSRHSPEVRARLERALQDLDRAFMGTIHAFCARLLRERPIEAGIDPGFLETTAPEANRLAARFWSLHLERLAAAGDPILGELEDVGLTPNDLRGLYEKLRENLDVDYPIEPSPPPDPASVALVRDGVESLLDEAQRLMPAEEPEKGWDPLQQWARSFRYIRKYRRWQDDRVFLDALGDLTPRSGLKVTQNRWSDTAAGKAAAVRLVDRANQLLGGDAKRLLDEWWAHRYPIAMRFALGAAHALEQHRRAGGHLDFQDLLALAARLLRTSPGAREALGTRWRRLLVDEFQDTDPLQAEVVFLLASGPDSDGGDWTRAVPRPGALFVVGDPKQSIYRFRRADIALYMQVRHRFAEFGDVLELIANFRSGEPIAELVNAAFAPPLGFPLQGHAAQAAFARLSPQPRKEPATLEGVFFYLVDPDDGTRDALSQWSASAVADWISRRTGPRGDRRAGDFLILTRKKDQLEAYARALEGRDLPVRVSGAGVGVEEEVSELTLLLQALTDPDDPSATLAVLVGLFFGIDHRQLLAHRQAGLGFDFRLARAQSDDTPQAPVEAALHRMKQWWELAREWPADVVVQRIASDLGLLPYAAAGELGSIRAGALAYVLDAVRSAGLAGDTSLAGALAALDTAMQDEEAEASLEPGRSDTIRLMNVHKAKGLEAKVVVLAAPYGEWDFPIDRHIERGAEGHARGWLRVEQKKSEYSVRTLARPLGWSQKEAAEREFEGAEDVRLLYVACTRAAEELVVARNKKRPDKSPWASLDHSLDLHALPLNVREVPAPEREQLETGPDEIRAAARATAEARARSASPTFTFESVTHAAKGRVSEAAVAPRQVEDSRPPAVASSPGPGGYEWGSAVHGVLEAAVRGAQGERLRAVARSLLLELDREVKNGEPTELDALLETAQRVMAHEVWRRAHASGRMLAEVPFTIERDDGSTPVYVEGVIDLAFREPDGWVIVDYKTDRGDDPTFAGRRESYREQLRIYSDAWQRLSGETVKERLLWFVRSGVIEAVHARVVG
jgi:ATP-dependent helicase/nuclease subunit A